MVKEDLDEKFKDPLNPFRLVFVCAMWMTGFDAPSVSTIYLDKPMKNHTLMQTIARANRVFKEKPSGLIVDYIGVFRNLQKALAIYGVGDQNKDGVMPVKPKDELVKDLVAKIKETKEFCIIKKIDLDNIIKVDVLQNIKLIDHAVDNLLENETTKSNYISIANAVNTIFKAILPDSKVAEYYQIVRLIRVIADKLRSFEEPVDISKVMDKVNDLLDKSVKAEPYLI